MRSYSFFRLVKGIIVLIAYVVIGWIAFAKPSWIILYSIFTSLIGYYLLLIGVTPAGSVVLGKREERLPFWQWYSAICMGNIMLGVFTIAAIIAFLGAGPKFTSDALSYHFSTEVIGQYTATHWGIFPWSIFILWALVLAYYTYVKKGVPIYYQMAEEGTPKWMEPAIKTFVESTCFTATWFSLGLVVTSIILLFSYAFHITFKFSHFIVPFITISLFCFVAPILSYRWGVRLFRNLAAKKASIFGLYFILIILMLPILLLSGYANGLIAQHYPDIVEKIECQGCFSFFNRVPVSDRFAVMYWSWWVMWCPLLGSYLARISKGRTIRELIFGMLSVPVLGYVLFKSLGDEWLKFALDWINEANHYPYFLVTIALLCLWFLYVLTCQYRFSNIFVSGAMKVSEEFKINRLWLKDATKVQGMSRFGTRVSTLILTLLILHTIGGWYMIQIQVAAIAAFAINMNYWAIQVTIWQFFRDKTWMGNQNIQPLKSAYVGVEKRKYKKGK